MARVLIAGAGALGSVFGGFLQRAGHQVTLYGRQPHLDAIAAAGLRIDGLWGDHCVTGFELRTALQPRDRFDAALLTVKSYDTTAMAAVVEPLLEESGAFISLQNGLGNVERLIEVAGPDRVLGGRVIFGAVIPKPGHVRVTVFAEPTLLGAWPCHRNGEASPLAVRQAEVWSAEIDAAGVPTQPCADIQAALWGKVFYNAALNPLGALLGVHYGALPESDHSRAIMNHVIEEADGIARAEGVRLPWASAAEYREIFYGRLVPSTYHHRSSMLQDLERGRRTEIDAINGALWSYAASHAMNAPFNEMLTRLMKAREEQRSDGGDPDRTECGHPGRD